MSLRLIRWAALVAAFSSACSSTSKNATVEACAPGPDRGDLPCDVSAIFQERCQHCHTTPRPPSPDNAPFPLRTHEDLVAPFGTTGMPRWQRVAQVIEPNNFPHMPPPTQPQLTRSDFETLRSWFSECAPAVPEETGCDVGESGRMVADASGDATHD